jgi:hypothetical protein
MTPTLHSDYHWYLTHKPELLKQHVGKVLAILHGTILGVYASESAAVRATVKTHPLGTFLVQPCQLHEPSPVFPSRVSLA